MTGSAPARDQASRALKVSGSVACEFCEHLERACEAVCRLRDETGESCVLPPSRGGGLGCVDDAEDLYGLELQIGGIRDVLRYAGWAGGWSAK